MTKPKTIILLALVAAGSYAAAVYFPVTAPQEPQERPDLVLTNCCELTGSWACVAPGGDLDLAVAAPNWNLAGHTCPGPVAEVFLEEHICPDCPICLEPVNVVHHAPDRNCCPFCNPDGCD